MDRIFIAHKQGQIADLRRTVLPSGVEAWTVNGLPANQFPVRTLLKTFLKVEVRTPVAKSMEAMTLKLMASNAIKVEIYTGGEKPEKESGGWAMVPPITSGCMRCWKSPASAAATAPSFWA